MLEIWLNTGEILWIQIVFNKIKNSNLIGSKNEYAKMLYGGE